MESYTVRKVKINDIAIYKKKNQHTSVVGKLSTSSEKLLRYIMSERTKKHLISTHAHGSTLHITHHNKTYIIPKKVIEQYAVEANKTKRKKKPAKSIESLFAKLDEQFTKAGALLKGLRLREGLTQVAFAKKIKVTQANLSNMENGKRPIGKIIAKRIEKVFGANYRYFLE